MKTFDRKIEIVETGGFFSDVADTASDAVDALSDVATSAWDLVDNVPGFEQLGEAVKDFAKGPFRDFARGDVGKTVLRAMTTTLMGPAMVLGGPILAMTASSLPGVLRGDSFDEAFLKENFWRLRTLAEVLSAGVVGKYVGQLGESINKIVERVRASLPPGVEPDFVKGAENLAKQAGLDPEAYARKMAAEMGIREDMAVSAMELLIKKKILDPAKYDIKSGKSLDTIRKEIYAKEASKPLAQKLEESQKSTDILSNLIEQRRAESIKENAKRVASMTTSQVLRESQATSNLMGELFKEREREEASKKAQKEAAKAISQSWGRAQKQYEAQTTQAAQAQTQAAQAQQAAQVQAQQAAQVQAQQAAQAALATNALEKSSQTSEKLSYEEAKSLWANRNIILVGGALVVGGLIFYFWKKS